MGREWNNKLKRRLQTSIVNSVDIGRVLVTDLEDSEWTLIEILSPDETDVLGEFRTKDPNRPTELRYREPQDWRSQRDPYDYPGMIAPSP